MNPRSQVARIVFALAAFIVAACRTGTTSPPHTVAGFVVFANLALPGVTVTLDVAGAQRTTITDATGHFEFTQVPNGKHRITAQFEGMQHASYTVTVTNAPRKLLQIPMRGAAVAEAIPLSGEAPTVISGAPSYDNLYIVDGIQEMAVLNGAISPEYGRFPSNPFVDTQKQSVSTFSIDVDTASYSIVRGTLAHGRLPDPGEVRIEEMVNYFTYSYPEPRDGKPFSVTTEVAGAPWSNDHRLLRVGIRATKLAPWEMKPCNLVFLIDSSGSMTHAAKLPLLKKAFRLLVEQLRAEDRVAIVTYAGAERLVLPSVSGAEKDRILGAIETLDSDGATNGAAGIVLAYQIAKQNFMEGGINRVILATDGDFNVGVSSEQDLEKLIEEKRKEDIELSVIGVGEENIKDTKMELLADKGNGNYGFVDNLLEARKVFVDQIGGTLVTVAKDVKLQLDFDPTQVASYRLIGYENRLLQTKDFDDDTKDAGELGSGHTVTALYDIVLTPGAHRGRIASLKLRYKAPRGSQSELIETSIADDGKSAWEASDDLKFAAAVAEFGMLLNDSPEKGASNWEEALQLAKVSRGADLEGYRGEFLKMVETARTIAAAQMARK